MFNTIRIIFWLSIYVNQHHFNRYSREVTFEPLNIIHQLFAIRNSAGHLFLHGVTGHNFNPNISLIFVEKILKFSHVIKHKSILTKLHFNQDFFLYEVNLFECPLYFYITIGDGNRILIPYFLKTEPVEGHFKPAIQIFKSI